MTRRRLLYWALWPVERACFFVAWCGQVLRAAFIARHPGLLAWWIFGRDKRRRREDQ